MVKQEEEENVAFAAKDRKGKSKQGASTSGKKGKGKQVTKEKDMFKVKCWACQQMGHYAGTCPMKKEKGKNVAASAEVEEFASQFDREFSFMASTSNSVVPSSWIWYVDSGASRHMTRGKDQFTQFLDRRINLEIELGDESIVRAVGIGTVTFQRESLSPLAVSEVLYVPGLRKNLISVSAIKNKGYEVTFRGG